jgi:hypothetical protein
VHLSERSFMASFPTLWLARLCIDYNPSACRWVAEK